MIDLAPCPFCGGDDIDPRFAVGQRASGESIVAVGCMECGAAGPDESSDAAAEAAWNRRASGWIPTDPLEEASDG